MQCACMHYYFCVNKSCYVRDFLQRLCLVSQLFSILGQAVILFAFVANLDDLSTFLPIFISRPSKAMSYEKKIIDCMLFCGLN